MKMQKCFNCQQIRGFSRKLGVGTIIMVVLTGGLWILLLPFYPKRCMNCGATPPSWLERLERPL